MKNQFDITKLTISHLGKFKVSASTKLTLLALIDYYPKIFPRQKTISKKIGVSLKSVNLAISELRDQGFLVTSQIEYLQTLKYEFSELFFETIQAYSRNEDKDYSLWRDAIFKKYKHTCQKCGQKGGELHAHHVKEYAKFPEKRFDIKNGTLLCKNCHSEIHPFMRNKA